MFFKKKYHTLKISNKKYKSLKKSFVFTAFEIDKIKKSIEFLSENENWEIKVVFDLKDQAMKPSDVLMIHHLLGDYLEIESVPEPIETFEEFSEYLKEKKVINE